MSKLKIVDPSDIIVEQTAWLFSQPSSYAIYGILNLLNGKIYIGSAVNIYHRLRTHRSKLKHNQHANKHLQSAWNEYGELAFEFVVLDYVLWKSNLVEREQAWMELTNCCEPQLGYNLRKIAKSNLGLKKPPVSEETRKRLSFANKGRKISDAQKQAISEFHKGKKRSPEHIASAVKGRAGYSHTTETIAKITVSNSMPDKWPHPDKSACKCRDCKDKRNFADRLRKYNHEGKYSL